MKPGEGKNIRKKRENPMRILFSFPSFPFFHFFFFFSIFLFREFFSYINVNLVLTLMVALMMMMIIMKILAMVWWWCCSLLTLDTLIIFSLKTIPSAFQWSGLPITLCTFSLGFTIIATQMTIIIIRVNYFIILMMIRIIITANEKKVNSFVCGKQKEIQTYNGKRNKQGESEKGEIEVTNVMINT